MDEEEEGTRQTLNNTKICQTTGSRSTGGVTQRNPIPYIFNDKFSQEDIFPIGMGVCQDTFISDQTYPDVVTKLGCGDSSLSD